MKTISLNKTIIVLLFAILVSSVNINVDAKVKKRRTNTRQTSANIPEGYSQALVDMANAGDADAQAYLGMCYEQGNGVQQNEQSALYWYEKAAAKGHAYAQAYAAMMYLQGKGTEIDEKKAFQLAQSAANQNNAYGEYVLGVCYLYGLGTDADVKKAWNWLKKASNKGVEYARNSLNEILADEDMSFEVNYDSKDWNTDSKAWNKAKSINTAIAYQKYLELYPEGLHKDEANDAYIEASIDKTLKGDYFDLPQSQKINDSYGTESTDEIKNDTGYKIEVLYSGPIKKRVIIEKNETKIITLKNGTYKIVAKVLTGTASNYYGTRSFDGGEYGGSFYIRSY